MSNDYCQACLNPGCTKDGLCERCRERVRAVAEEVEIILRGREISAADSAFLAANGIPERHLPS